MGGDGNSYVGDTKWHSDSTGKDFEFEFDFDRIKVALYLDPVTKDTGCLRVIPGSHRIHLHQQIESLRHLRVAQRDVGGKTMSKEEQKKAGIAGEFDDAPFGVESSKLPSFALESQPGDVVFFNHRLWHSSFGGKTGRRMFTLNFAERPKSEDDVATLREDYESILKSTRTQDNPTGQVYSDAYHDSDHPRIQSMMTVPKELGFN